MTRAVSLSFAVVLAGTTACRSPSPSPTSTPTPATALPGAVAGPARVPPADDARWLVIRGARAPGGAPLTLIARGAKLAGARDAARAEEAPPSQREEVDAAGRYAVPAFIDSHVHLTYLAEGPAMLRGGVAAVVDLGAPLRSLQATPRGDVPFVVASGPILTARGGYPTRTWGADGYGLEIAGTAETTAAVTRLHRAGARVLKVALDDEPSLTDDELAAAVRRARELGMRSVAHALGDRSVRRAARAGVDALAHAPPAELSSQALDGWSRGAVIGTLVAFSGTAALRQLRARGATVLYGTDFGNVREPGIHPGELEALTRAGLTGEQIVEAATSAPARFWGLARLGALEEGRSASFILVRDDPHLRPETLSNPDIVVVEGRVVHRRP